MYLNFKFNFRKFLIALLSAFMAVMLAFSVACDGGGDDGGDDDGDDTTTTTVTDYQEIENGDFEFYTTEKTSYPYTASIKWSKMTGSDVTVSPSSSASSGIIDTQDSVFDKLTTANKPSANPGTPWSKGLLTEADDKYDEDDNEFSSYPQIKGSKVLMINNKNDEGCAQAYKASSQITLSTESYAVVSLWIKTLDIASEYKTNAGAYVKLVPTSSNKSFEPFILDNINTKGEWAKITVAFEGSELNSTNLSLTVGLGEGNGTDYNDLVKGCVFIDNVYLHSIDKDTYATYDSYQNFKIEDLGRVDLSSTVYVQNSTESTTVTDKYTALNYKLDLNDIDDTANFLTKVNLAPSSIKYGSAKAGYNYANGNVIGVGDVNSAKNASNSIKDVVGGNANGFTNFIYMNFANNSSANYVTDEFVIEAGKFDYFTFFANVKTFNSNSDKLKLDVIDLTNGQSKEVTTSMISSFDTSDLESERYGNFIKYQAFVNNPTDKPAKYKLKFTFGFDGEWVDEFALQKGHAVIADLAYHRDIDASFYNNTASSATIAKTQIYGEYVSYENVAETTTGNDIYPIAVDKSQTFTVMNKPATNVADYAFKTTDKANVTHGIINSKYYDPATNNYGTYGAFVNGMSADTVKALTTTGNKYLQALVIDNKADITSKYVSSVQSIVKEALYKITVKVRVLGNSTAKVQLVSATPNASNDYDVIKVEANDKSYELSSTVNSSSYVKDGWTSVHFYLKAGNETFKYRVAIVNEGRGTILTEGANYANIDAAKFASDKRAIKFDFESYNNVLDEYKFTSMSHTRPNSTVKTTGENGEVVETIKTYTPTEIYFANNYAKFVTFETLMADDVIDNTTPSDTTTEEDDHDHEDEYSVSLDATLQISSIIIALVLIAVIVVILLRKAFAKRAKRIEKVERYYDNNGFDRDARERTYNKVARQKAKIALAEDDEEYDYTQAENVDETEEDVEAFTEEVDEISEEVSETTETVENETTDSENN